MRYHRAWFQLEVNLVFVFSLRFLKNKVTVGGI